MTTELSSPTPRGNSTSQPIPFTKMQGTGNDFVMVDATRHHVAAPSELAKSICDRHFGVGADGLILASKDEDGALRMTMYNPDGSESEMCGNGIRCFAIFVRERGLTSEKLVPVETGAGTLTVEILNDDRVKVDMGHARLSPQEIGMIGVAGTNFIGQPIQSNGKSFVGTAVSMGNPHLVVFTEDVKKIELEKVGPELEHHGLFPKRVNVHFVQVVDKCNIIQRTWERGAGITLACGTGACACAVASFLNGHTGRNVTVSLPGGKLEINFEESGRVWMTGPAEKVYEATWRHS